MAWPLVETFCGFPYLCDGELLRQLLDPLVVGQVGGLLLALGLNLTAQLACVHRLLREAAEKKFLH